MLDLSALDLDAFWTVLDHKSLVYPFDAQGRRRDFADIPKTVMQLKDDPFRSLAGELRRSGRFCQGHHPVQRISVGGFPAPENLAQKRGGKLRQGDGEGARFCQEQGRGLSAGLVRPQGRRMIAGQCSPTRRSNRMWVARSDWQPCIIRKSEFESLRLQTSRCRTWV